jgi:hypothetical protein
MFCVIIIYLFFEKKPTHTFDRLNLVAIADVTPETESLLAQFVSDEKLTFPIGIAATDMAGAPVRARSRFMRRCFDDCLNVIRSMLF